VGGVKILGFLDRFRQKKPVKKKQPEYATPYRLWELSNKGLHLVQSGRLEEGIAVLEQAIELDPNNATAHINLGFAYAKKGWLDQAIKEHKRAIELDPKDANAHSHLGNVYYDRGWFEQATAEYKRAIELDPDDATAHFNLASAHYSSRRFDLAWKHVRMAEKLGMPTQNINHLVGLLRKVSTEPRDEYTPIDESERKSLATESKVEKISVPPMAEGEDPFSEKVVAELKEEGLTINWRYGYKLANRYEVKRVCSGGQAVVYIVEDLMEKDKRYAAKSLKEYFRKPETEEEWEKWRYSVNKYLEECNVWVGLGKHRHIVHAEYLDKIEGVPLVMSEFIVGGDLNERLKKGSLGVVTALDVAIQFCIGMEYANNKGVVVHRDIKPGNILVTEDGVAKVNDFGLVKAEMISGTPEYMSPEQFETMDVDTRADIYSFGVVLYQMLTGRPPFWTGEEERRWVFCEEHHRETQPRCPRHVNPSIPRELDEVVMKCLEKKINDRYQSFEALREDLMRIYRQEAGREFRVVEEPPYMPNWRNMGKTYWVLGREKEAFECYDKALEQNSADTLVWLEKGLASAEAGDLGEFRLCMEIMLYLKPSRKTEVQQCKEAILDEPRIRLRDMRFLDRLALDYPVPEEVRDWVSSEIAQEFRDPFHELNPVLSKRLEELKDGSPSVREKAALALGKLGDTTAVPALIDALKNDTYWAREAAMALGELGDSLAVQVLIETLKDESSMQDDSTRGFKAAVRERTATALGKLGDRSAVPALIAALKDEYSSVRWEAATALGKLGDRSAIPALIAILKGEDYWVREKAALALGKLGDTSVMPVLMVALKDEDREVRRSSALALGELGDRSAASALIAALNDEDHSVRNNVAEALGKLGNRTAVPALIKTLNDEHKWVRGVAAEALGKLGDRTAVPALIEALKDEDYWVRQKTALALGKLGDTTAVPALIKTLNDGYSLVQHNIAEALGKLGDTTAVPALIEALKDEDHSMREGAVMALGELGDRSAASALIAALNDEDHWVSWKAAEALGKLGDTTAVPALIEALKDVWTRKHAAEALGKLGDTTAVPALIEALNGELTRKHAEEKEAHGFISEYGPKTYSELKSIKDALCNLGDWSAVPALMEALTSSPEPSGVFVVLRWACSQPDGAKLSETKDKLRAYSAFEMNKKGSELKAEGQ
jgi:HEAT repeat protein/TPR repeat protein